MINQSDSRLIALFRSISKIAAVIAIFVGSLVLAGWLFDVAVLKSVLPTLVTMKPNTALAFILGGASLRLMLGADVSQRSLRIARIFASTAGLIALLTLFAHLFNLDLGIDQLLFKDPAVGSSPSGRMAFATTVNFLAIGLALLF